MIKEGLENEGRQAVLRVHIPGDAEALARKDFQQSRLLDKLPS